MKQIVLASGNQGKLREFNQLLAELQYEVLPQSVFTNIEADETGLSFVENAILKARHASRVSGLAALADDSGLEVDVLDGAPGIYSARFAGDQASDKDNNHELIRRLSGFDAEKRTARFQCVLVFMRHWKDPTPLICQGTWEGVIVDTPKGVNGFGYDPLFYIPELGCCSAELSPEKKGQLSHRSKAVAQLLPALQKLLAS